MTTETKVGAFVITALVLLGAVVYGVRATQSGGGQVQFKTYLRDAGGLESDTSVLFGGIKVGRITAVGPAADDPTRIEVAFQVKAGTPLNRRSTAKVATISLMGSPALMITTGTNDAPRLAPGDVVPSEEGVSTSDLTRHLGTVVDNANAVLLDLHQEIPGIAAQLHSALGNINSLTGADNQQQIRSVLAGVRTLVGDADAVVVAAKPVMGNIDQTVTNVSRTFDSVRGTVDSIHEPLVNDLQALHDTLEEARGAIATIQGVVRTNEGDFAETMRALRTTAENLRAMSEELKARPWSLIRTTQSADRKVPR